MIGHVTPWGVPCGIGKHLSYWIGALKRPQIILAEHPPRWQPPAEEWPGPHVVIRCWRRGDPGGFDGVQAAAEEAGVKLLCIQYDPTFWHHRAICGLSDWAKDVGIRLVFRWHIISPGKGFIWQNKAILRAADALIVGTPAMQRVLQEFADSYHIRLNAEIAVIPLSAPSLNGIPDRPARPEGPLILTWGMLGHFKGHAETFEAVKLLRANGYPKARYVICGQAFTGEQRLNVERLSKLAAEAPELLELRLGFIAEKELLSLCQTADCIVLNHQTDHYSSSGTIVLSVASGSPVVVSNSPMFSGFSDRGLAIPTDGSAGGIAAGIQTALRESDALRARAFGASYGFSPEAIAAMNERIFSSLLEAAA